MDLQLQEVQLADCLFSDVTIGNLMRETASAVINDFNKKRNKIVTDRLKEIVGIDLNIEEEARRKFKRLVIEYKGNEETIYFTGGIINRIRIVTFVRKDIPLSFENNMAQMSQEYYYY